MFLNSNLRKDGNTVPPPTHATPRIVTTQMQSFLKTVQQHYKKERKVLFNADKLHLSAGYLSTIIKNISRKTAAEWIGDYVILEAKALLKSTNLTIQHIKVQSKYSIDGRSILLQKEQ